jgi:hypothetical protein
VKNDADLSHRKRGTRSVRRRARRKAKLRRARLRRSSGQRRTYR